MSPDLIAWFGRGLGAYNLELMRLFCQCYGDDEMSESAIRKSGAPVAVSNSESPIRNFSLEQLAQRFPLSRTRYVRLIRRVRSREERHFYGVEALRGGWSVRQLERLMDSQFYTRTLMPRNKRAMLKTGAVARLDDAVTPEQAIKDPYVLEFLNLKNEYSESDLEDVLIHRLGDFLTELGGDFAFVGRHRRLRTGDSWFRVDLLFFHKRLAALSRYH